MRSVTVMKPFVVMSILPTPSAVESDWLVPRSVSVASTSVVAVNEIVVSKPFMALRLCWTEMSRPARTSVKVYALLIVEGVVPRVVNAPTFVYASPVSGRKCRSYSGQP